MAHFEKFNKGNAKRVMREAFRECDSKSEFYEKEKSVLNLYAKNANIDKILKDFPPKRKDAVITINEIITRPKGLKEEDTIEFYKSVAEFTSDKLNSAGVLYCCIHNDELNQHAHISYLALNRDTHKWQAKTMLNKSFLNNYHKELEQFLYKKFNYLIEVRKDNKEEHLTFEEYKAMKKEEDKEKEQEQKTIDYFEL